VSALNRESAKIQLRLSSDVARIMSNKEGHDIRLSAARGILPLAAPDLVTALFVFIHSNNDELKETASYTLKHLPQNLLLAAFEQHDLHSAIVDLIVRVRGLDQDVAKAALGHRQIRISTLIYLAEQSRGEVLSLLVQRQIDWRRSEALRHALIKNPHSDMEMKLRLGWVPPKAEPDENASREDVTSEEVEAADTPPEDVVDTSGEDDEDDSFSVEDLDEEGLSKFQLLQEMTVAEKIKMALTGDKEWRSLLIRESNKQINTAVLRNSRITDAEVLSVAQNRTSNEELIRLILLNKDWVKQYDIKKALVSHPRTPLRIALKFMNFLSEKDIKKIVISRNVSQAILTNARRMLATRSR